MREGGREGGRGGREGGREGRASHCIALTQTHLI